MLQGPTARFDGYYTTTVRAQTSLRMTEVMMTMATTVMMVTAKMKMVMVMTMMQMRVP